jgi:hypothetical protein
MSRLAETSNYFKGADLDTLLEEIQVQQINESDSSITTKGVDNWFGVSNHEGIIAYFGTEEEALFYRLALINRILNYKNYLNENRN